MKKHISPTEETGDGSPSPFFILPCERTVFCSAGINSEKAHKVLRRMEQAKNQAEQSGHSLDNEIALLEIHGLLHLLGYDHANDEQREEMWKFQNAYLDQCGIKLNRRPGEDFDF